MASSEVYSSELSMVHTMALWWAICVFVFSNWRLWNKRRRSIPFRTFLYYVMNKYCALDWSNQTDVL